MAGVSDSLIVYRNMHAQRAFMLEPLCDQPFMLYTSRICSMVQAVGDSRNVDNCLNVPMLVIRKPGESASWVRLRTGKENSSARQDAKFHGTTDP